ncbi:MAG: GDYXXLXY domain-containing protein [Waterburya sp.]
MTTNNNLMPQWRFFLPLSLQMLLILAVPAQAIYTHYTGKIIVLQTMPVDPYDLLRGYSQTLSYDISRTSDLAKLPGGEILNQSQSNLKNGMKLYVILESPKTSAAKPPQPWQPVAVSLKRPSNLPDNRVALAGIVKYGAIAYGLETYYLPEDKISDINQEITQLQPDSDSKRPFVVEVKVDAQGNSVASSLWIGKHNYRY